MANKVIGTGEVEIIFNYEKNMKKLFDDVKKQWASVGIDKQLENVANSIKKIEIATKAETTAKTQSNKVKKEEANLNEKLINQRISLDKASKNANATQKEYINSLKQQLTEGKKLESWQKERVKLLGDENEQVKANTISYGFLSYEIARMGDVMFNAVKGAVTLQAELEKSIAITGAVAGATKSEVEALDKAMIQMGTEVPIKFEKIGESMYNMASAGLNANEILQAMPKAVKLSAGVGEDLNQTIELLISSVKGFDLEFSESSEILDIFANSVAKSMGTIEKLQVSFARVAPIAKQAGVSFEETTAILSKLYDLGLRGSNAGTVLANVMTKLTDFTDQSTKALAGAGLTISDVSLEYNSLGESLAKLNMKMKEGRIGASELQKVFGMRGKIITDFMGQMEGNSIDEMVASYDKLVKSISDADGAVDKFFSSQEETTQMALDRMTNSSDRLKKAFGELLKDSVVPLAEGMANINNKIAETIEHGGALADMLKVVAPLVAGLGKVMSVLGQIALPLIALKTVFPAISAGLVGIGEALTGMAVLGSGATVLGAITAPAWVSIAVGIVAVSTALAGLWQAVKYFGGKEAREINRNFEQAFGEETFVKYLMYNKNFTLELEKERNKRLKDAKSESEKEKIELDYKKALLDDYANYTKDSARQIRDESSFEENKKLKAKFLETEKNYNKEYLKDSEYTRIKLEQERDRRLRSAKTESQKMEAEQDYMKASLNDYSKWMQDKNKYLSEQQNLLYLEISNNFTDLLDAFKDTSKEMGEALLKTLDFYVEFTKGMSNEVKKQIAIEASKGDAMSVYYKNGGDSAKAIQAYEASYNLYSKSLKLGGSDSSESKKRIQAIINNLKPKTPENDNGRGGSKPTITNEFPNYESLAKQALDSYIENQQKLINQEYEVKRNAILKSKDSEMEKNKKLSILQEAQEKELLEKKMSALYMSSDELVNLIKEKLPAEVSKKLITTTKVATGKKDKNGKMTYDTKETVDWSSFDKELKGQILEYINSTLSNESESEAIKKLTSMISMNKNYVENYVKGLQEIAELGELFEDGNLSESYKKKIELQMGMSIQKLIETPKDTPFKEVETTGGEYDQSALDAIFNDNLEIAKKNKEARENYEAKMKSFSSDLKTKGIDQTIYERSDEILRSLEERRSSAEKTFEVEFNKLNTRLNELMSKGVKSVIDEKEIEDIQRQIVMLKEGNTALMGTFKSGINLVNETTKRVEQEMKDTFAEYSQERDNVLTNFKNNLDRLKTLISKYEEKGSDKSMYLAGIEATLGSMGERFNGLFSAYLNSGVEAFSELLRVSVSEELVDKGILKQGTDISKVDVGFLRSQVKAKADSLGQNATDAEKKSNDELFKLIDILESLGVVAKETGEKIKGTWDDIFSGLASLSSTIGDNLIGNTFNAIASIGQLGSAINSLSKMNSSAWGSLGGFTKGLGYAGVAIGAFQTIKGLMDNDGVAEDNAKNVKLWEDTLTGMDEILDTLNSNFSSLISYTQELVKNTTPTTTNIAKGSSQIQSIADILASQNKNFSNITYTSSHTGTRHGRNKTIQRTSGMDLQQLYSRLGFTGDVDTTATLEQLQAFADKLNSISLSEFNSMFQLDNEDLEDFDLQQANFKQLSAEIQAYVDMLAKAEEQAKQFSRNSTLSDFEGLEVQDSDELFQSYIDQYEEMGITITDAIKKQLKELANENSIQETMSSSVRDGVVNGLVEGLSMSESMQAGLTTMFSGIMTNVAKTIYDTILDDFNNSISSFYLGYMNELEAIKSAGGDTQAFAEQYDYSTIMNAIKSASELQLSMEAVSDALRKQAEEAGIDSELIDYMLSDTYRIELRSSIEDAVSSGIMDGFNNKDMTVEGIKSSIFSTVVNSAMDDIISSVLDASEVKDSITDLMDAIEDGDVSSLEELGNILAENVNSELDKSKDSIQILMDLLAEMTGENTEPIVFFDENSLESINKTVKELENFKLSTDSLSAQTETIKRIEIEIIGNGLSEAELKEVAKKVAEVTNVEVISTSRYI